MMSVTSCKASQTSCNNGQSLSWCLVSPTHGSHHQECFGRFRRNCVGSEDVSPVFQVAAVSIEASTRTCVQLPSNLRVAAQVCHLGHSLLPPVLHELPELLESDSISAPRGHPEQSRPAPSWWDSAALQHEVARTNLQHQHDIRQPASLTSPLTNYKERSKPLQSQYSSDQWTGQGTLGHSSKLRQSVTEQHSLL